jgi:PIN domain nuclease of toxin-antitoxin system
MKVLLDTAAFLWFVMGDAKLTAAARSAIEEPANDKFVSVASAWEIAIKTSIGKLALAEPFEVLVPREIRQNGFHLLPIELGHLAELLKLPPHHRDPFDRLLVAQGNAESMSVITPDTAFDAYGVRRLW